MVVEQRSGPWAGSEERGSVNDTGSMNVDGEHEPDLPKKLLLETATQMRLLPSSASLTYPYTLTIANIAV